MAKKQNNNLNLKNFWTKKRALKQRKIDKQSGMKVSRIIHTKGTKSGHSEYRERYGYNAVMKSQYWCPKCRRAHYSNSKIGKQHRK